MATSSRFRSSRTRTDRPRYCDDCCADPPGAKCVQSSARSRSDRPSGARKGSVSDRYHLRKKNGGEKEPPLAHCFDCVFLPIPALRTVEDSSQSVQRDGTLSAESVRDGAIRSGVEGGSHLRTLCVPSLASSLFLVAKHSQQHSDSEPTGLQFVYKSPSF